MIGHHGGMRWRWRLMVAVGVVVMAVASLWAPEQPELLPTGGACQFAPCGSLEDPERWRLAWWLWAAGAAVAIPAAALVDRGRRAPRWPVLLVLAVEVPLFALGLALLAVVVALLTSVHGAATTVVVGALPVVAVVSSWVRGCRVG